MANAKFSVGDIVEFIPTGKHYTITERFYDEDDDIFHYMLGTTHICNCNKCTYKYNNELFQDEDKLKGV